MLPAGVRTRRDASWRWRSPVKAKSSTAPATGLYDPALDLAAIAPDGSVAGYALFWNDAVTGVGLVEPMRVEDAHARRGIGRALLTSGLDRLAVAGATRLKVGWVTEPARALYVGVGFREAANLVSYAWRRR